MKKVTIAIGTWFLGILLLVGLFLSIWIVLPAPIFSLLPLSVGAPEISPGLIIFNVSVPILYWAILSRGDYHQPRLLFISLCLSGLATILSASPLIQFSSAQQQAHRSIVASLGQDYLKLPPSLTDKM